MTAKKVQMSLPSQGGAHCTACGVEFTSGEDMRKHYQTEFHLQNVRNRVEGKAPLTRSEFRRLFGAGVADEEDEAKPTFACKLCQKTFHSVQTLQSHVKSTEHLIRKEQKIIARDSNAGSMLSSTSLGSAALGLHRRHKAHTRARDQLKADAAKKQHVDPATTAAAASSSAVAASPVAAPTQAAPVKVAFEDREADVTETRCLFCGLHSSTMKTNLKHLLEVHEFTIPLQHRCKDVVGLLRYLARKINGCMCLVCGEDSKKFQSLEALRAHMSACNHERMVMTSEYAEFYDGKVDDGDVAPILENLDRKRMQLVVANGKKVLTFRTRDATTGAIERPKVSKELPEQAAERRMITMAAQAETAVILKERREATKKEDQKEKRVKEHNEQRYQREQFRKGMRLNKMHPKGYDGEGEVN